MRMMSNVKVGTQNTKNIVREGIRAGLIPFNTKVCFGATEGTIIGPPETLNYRKEPRMLVYVMLDSPIDRMQRHEHRLAK